MVEGIFPQRAFVHFSARRVRDELPRKGITAVTQHSLGEERHLPRTRILSAEIGVRSYLARAKYSQQLVIAYPLRVQRKYRGTHRNRHFVLLVDSSLFVRASLAMVW